jgi:hypothetical protein
MFQLSKNLMFQWSKKVVKSVTFNPEIVDESLLAQVESHLEEHPEKSFSDLCKEALWQALCVQESVPPSPNIAVHSMEQKVDELQRQIAGLEERFFAKESNRLQVMESQMLQLSQQVAQLAIMVNQTASTQPETVISSVPTVEVINEEPVNSDTTPEEVDPIINPLSSLFEDF